MQVIIWWRGVEGSATSQQEQQQQAADSIPAESHSFPSKNHGMGQRDRFTPPISGRKFGQAQEALARRDETIS